MFHQSICLESTRRKTRSDISTAPLVAAGPWSHSGNPALMAAQSHTEGSGLERGGGDIICCFLHTPKGMVILLLLIISPKFDSL